MNFLKTLMIMVVLAAVTYGVYVSLARNNIEPVLPPEVADQWHPGAPSPDMSGASQVAPGGPLPISGTPAQPNGNLGIGMGTGPLPPPSSPGQLPGYNPPAGAPELAPATPYPPSGGSPPQSDSFPPFAPPVSPDLAAGPPMASPGGVTNLAPPPAAPAAAEDDQLRTKFTEFMDAVRKSLDEGKLAEAHLHLSALYVHPDLPAEQARQIVGMLDQLAGTVIYSRKHYLEPAYYAKPGETIEQVARQYNVPWQLLARINGLMPPEASNNDEATKSQPLPEGMELKVLRGPFDAVVDLKKRELTLMLQDRYAGRFPIGIGRDQPIVEGAYTVRDKILDPAYNGADGVSFANDDPKNPLGDAWIGLTDQIGIHGVGDPSGIGRDDNRGSICVGPRDIQDLYGILSVGSRVKVLR